MIPLGYHETMYLLDNGLSNKSNALVAMAGDQSASAGPANYPMYRSFEHVGATVESLFNLAVSQHRVIFSSFDDPPQEHLSEKVCGRPPGFCAQTILHVGGHEYNGVA